VESAEKKKVGSGKKESGKCGKKESGKKKVGEQCAKLEIYFMQSLVV